MTTKTIECTECGASVTYGRLSCPECGSLLASVAGQRARPIAVPGSSSIEPSTNGRVEPVAARSVAGDDVGPGAAGPARGPAAVEGVEADGPTELAPEPPSMLAPEPPSMLAPEPQSVLAPEPADPPPAARPPGPTLSPRAASLYRRPMLATAAVTTGAVTTGAPQWPSAASPTTEAEPSPVTTATTATTDPKDSMARWSSTLEPTRILEIAGWFVLVGAAMSTLGFLLPWSRVVIGAGDVGGYLSTWGLASPTHLFVFLATLGVLALAIVQTTVPAWITSGVAGLTLGALLIGLSWPYLVGPLGADLGIRVVSLGGLALIVGGVLATWSSRHVEAERSV
jgi:hypothetical protein